MSAPGGRGDDAARAGEAAPSGPIAPLPRVRVTAAAAASDRRATPADGPAREAGAVYARSLMRGQLRLAVGCLLAFLLVAGAFTAAIFVLAGVEETIAFGVPLSWLLQAYGYYPIVLFFAVVFARSASRNERRYRALTEHEPAESAAS